ncbi:uncharacterized protein LOC113333876 [Papaver somniferum]|uniref:uncharacterized protein LOC113333876 n=1 Tax=Papaver somniferum TaxID=3469 RepID=UPI000E7011FA|nr:uncharacterized protein LOC113333876 [Papaver somniferum]
MTIILDMSKAFDRIEWDFLDAILKKLGFHDDWCKMVYECVSIVYASVLLNGTPGEGIKVTRDSPAISHLFFVDDCLIFTKANNVNAKQIESIAFNPKLDNSIKVNISELLNIKKLAIDDKYLGVPLLIQRNRTETFSHLEEKFHGRLAIWKGKHINQPTRTIMTQSVLDSLASHHLEVFPMPKKLTDRLDSIQMNFWWNKSKKRRGSFIWKGICMGLEIIREHCCWEIGDGKSVSIWDDKWIPDLGHKVKSPRLESQRLTKHVQGKDASCPLCKSAPETLDHLFINCPVTREVWFALESNFTGTILWNICKAICSTVFDNIELQVNKLVSHIQKELNDWNEHLSQQAAQHVHLTIHRVEVRWTLPRTWFS